jgi:hypothetical protein
MKIRIVQNINQKGKRTHSLRIEDIAQDIVETMLKIGGSSTHKTLILSRKYNIKDNKYKE